MHCGPIINNPCSSYPDTKCIIYTGPNLNNINSFTNDRLEKILQNINNVIGNTSSYINSVSNTSTITLSVVNHNLTASFASLDISQFTNDSGYITDLSSFTTDDLAEGVINLYDKTVVLTQGSGITITGTYPNFTISNSSPSTGGTVTSVSAGTGMSFSTITTSGSVNIDTTKVPYLSSGFSSGFFKWNGSSWIFDNSTYLTQNQTITLSGDVTGSGNTAINTSILDTVVTGKLLTGYVSGPGIISATDSILSAIQKLNGNIAALTTGVSSVFGRTGIVTAQAGDYTTTLVTEGTNLYFTNARAIASTLTGYTSGAGTITSSDSILTAIQKLNGNISGLSSTYFPLTGGSITGTAGAGFFGAISQSSTPSTPASGFRLYADSTNRLSWIGTNGFVRTFDGTSNTANRTYTLPDASGTIALTSDVPSAANPTGTIGLTAVNGAASTFMRSDAAPALSQSIAPTWTGLHTFSRSATASGAIARGGLFSPSLTAAANNDVLVALDIAPTFTNGAFTGVANADIRTTRWANFGTTNNTGIVIGNPAWSGGAPINGLRITLNSGSGVASYNNSSGGGFSHQFLTSATTRFIIADSYVSVSNSLLVGTTTTLTGAVAVFNSTTAGVVLPRMTTVQKNAISTPTAGTLVYDTTLNQLSYYNGTTWVNI